MRRLTQPETTDQIEQVLPYRIGPARARDCWSRNTWLRLPACHGGRDNAPMARRRKEPVYRFSGPDTLGPAAVREAVATAATVQFSQGGFLIRAVDPEADVLEESTEKYAALRRQGDGPRITDRAPIADLIDALAVTEVTDMLCMCSGDFAAGSFDENHRLLGVVRIDMPNRRTGLTLRSPGSSPPRSRLRRCATNSAL